MSRVHPPPCFPPPCSPADALRRRAPAGGAAGRPAGARLPSALQPGCDTAARTGVVGTPHALGVWCTHGWPACWLRSGPLPLPLLRPTCPAQHRSWRQRLRSRRCGWACPPPPAETWPPRWAPPAGPWSKCFCQVCGAAGAGARSSAALDAWPAAHRRRSAGGGWPPPPRPALSPRPPAPVPCPRSASVNKLAFNLEKGNVQRLYHSTKTYM